MFKRQNQLRINAFFCAALALSATAIACGPDKSGAKSSNPESAAAGDIAVGKPAPSLAPSGGAELEWSALQGKVVLVDFWASWCAPCREELPELEELHKKYGDQGLKIIGVNIDEERAAMDQFLQQMPLSFTMVYDDGQAIAERWAPPKMPTSYIIDKSGNVQLIQEGFERTDLDAMVAKIEELLGA